MSEWLSGAEVAVAGCLAADGVSVHPDADWVSLDSELARRAVRAELVAWDDVTVDWQRFEMVVIRSTWTSVDRPADYMRWVRRVAEDAQLHNDADVVEWNLDKRYSLELEAARVPVAPTTWLATSQSWTPPAGPFVVKPAVSGGGRETALYANDRQLADAHVRRLQSQGQAVMVQPHIAGVDAPGEVKMVFIEGRFSHAIQVGALLEAGHPIEFVAPRSCSARVKPPLTHHEPGRAAS